MKTDIRVSIYHTNKDEKSRGYGSGGDFYIITEEIEKLIKQCPITYKLMP